MRDVERIAAEAEVEAARVANELQHVDKAKETQELIAATGTQLEEHRGPQSGERVAYEVLGHSHGLGWPRADEGRASLMDQRATGTVYGTHYAIRFTLKQMVPTPVLFA